MEALGRWLAWVRRLPPVGLLRRDLARACSRSAHLAPWSSALRSASKAPPNFNQPAPQKRGRFCFLGCAIRPRSEGVNSHGTTPTPCSAEVSMRKPFLTSVLLAVTLTSFPAKESGQRVRPIPPGVREADKQTNKSLDPPLGPNLTVQDPAKLKQEAEELAQLSAGIPPRVNLVAEGQLPKDLGDRLRRIEKLAKHLRSEVTP